MKSSAMRLGRRGAVAGGAYLATSLIVLAALYVLNRHGDADLLRQVLAIHFIASLAAGLEPATAKAAALSGTAIGPERPSQRMIVLASSLKALLASPVLALVWWLADPAMDARLLLFTPLICVAGFAATDLRVLYDLRGRHTAAIWIKQGSLGGGLIILAGLGMLGAPLLLALGASTFARLLLILVLSGRSTPPEPDHGGPTLVALLGDPLWVSLAGASVIAAIGGSTDRVFGLRFLSPEAWAAYFALYEIFSKFWFIPYVIVPVIFARAATGRDASVVTRWALVLTAASGALLTGGVGAALWLYPDLPRIVLGAKLDAGIPGYAVVAFAGAVALNSLAQIRIAELQGRGAVNRTFLLMALSAIATIAVFYIAAREFGAAGLLCAWLAKALFELCLAYAPIRPALVSTTQTRGWAAARDAGM